MRTAAARRKAQAPPRRAGKGKSATGGQKPAKGQRGASLKTLAEEWLHVLKTDPTGYTDPQGSQGERGNETHLAADAVPALAEMMRTIAHRLRESAADGQPERDRLAQSLKDALPALVEAALLLEQVINRDCKKLAAEARTSALRRATAWPITYLAHAGERAAALDEIAMDLAPIAGGLTMKTQGKGRASVHVQAALDVILHVERQLPLLVAGHTAAPVPRDRDGRVMLPKEDRLGRWEAVFDYVAEQRHRRRAVFAAGSWSRKHMNTIRPAILRNLDTARFRAAVFAAVEVIELRRRQAMDAGAASRREQAADIEADTKRMLAAERETLAAATTSSKAKRNKAR